MFVALWGLVLLYRLVALRWLALVALWPAAACGVLAIAFRTLCEWSQIGAYCNLQLAVGILLPLLS